MRKEEEEVQPIYYNRQWYMKNLKTGEMKEASPYEMQVWGLCQD